MITYLPTKVTGTEAIEVVGATVIYLVTLLARFFPNPELLV